MNKLILCCLIIVSFSCPLLSLPIINASEMSYQHSGKSLLIVMVIMQGLEHQTRKAADVLSKGPACAAQL